MTTFYYGKEEVRRAVMGAYSECDMCMNYAYDEEFDEYECMVYLDEDELARYLSREYKACPYFQGGDEYKIVRKQM